MAEQDGDYWKARGNELFAKKEFEKALDAYSKAIEIDATNAVFWSNRSFSYLKLEKYGAAASDASKAIEIDPSFTKAYYRRGAALLSLFKYQDALRDFKTVLQHHPNDPEAKKKQVLCEKEIRSQMFLEAIETEASKAAWESIDLSKMSIDDSYPGPRDCSTAADARGIADYFRDQKLIHKRVLCSILLQARALFAAMPSLVNISVAAGQHITVCGDTHGQYYDLLHIFETNGWPSLQNPYLFNGDFVDRGSWSVEVVSLLLGFSCAVPGSIYLSRGNHESKHLNRVYGFHGEVIKKYDNTVFELFEDVFQALPLAYVVNDRVFVCHGGLPAPTDKGPVRLEDIRRIPRLSYGDIPDSGIMSDLLWADPFDGKGLAPSKRGVGLQFGSDITKQFLDANNLELLVRSHEVKANGYEEAHDGRCITIFSAPNYCDQTGNLGAYIRFSAVREERSATESNGRGLPLKKEFFQFREVSHPAVPAMAYAPGYM